MSSLRYIPFFILSLSLATCQTDEPEEAIVVEDHGGLVWSDSIFGAISEKERYYQHLVIEIPAIYQKKIDSLGNWIIENQPGGLKFENWQADSILQLRYRLDTCEIIQPLIYAKYFEDLEIITYPYWECNKKLRSCEFIKIFGKSKMNLLDFQEDFDWTKNFQEWLDSIRSNQNLFPIVRHYSDKNLGRDYDQFFSELRTIDHLFELKLSVYDTVNLEGLRKSGGFEGLFIIDAKNRSTNKLLAGGADLLYKNIESEDQFENWKLNKENKAFAESTKRILNLKSKIVNVKSQKQNFDSELKYVQSNLQQKGSSVISNKGKVLPFENRFSIYTEEKARIHPKVKRDDDILTYKKAFTEDFISRLIMAEDAKVICLSDSVAEDVLDVLTEVDPDHDIVVCFRNPDHFEKLKAIPNLVFCPANQNLNYTVLAQQLNAKIRISAGFYYEDSLYQGIKIPKIKLARTMPEFVGLDRDTLARIGWGIHGAMGGRAFPGCQVIIAKNGCIVYDKSFGHHSYEREKLVTPQSMYDLASLTKVVSTTMIGMKLYEMGSFKLSDSLHKYQPDSLRLHLKFASSIRNITFQELFIHKSGLPAGFPIIDYMIYTTEEIGRFDKYYCDYPDSTYVTEVAENFYMEKEYQDSMWLKLNSIWLNKAKPYKYSDVSMNMLYFFFKSIIANNRRKYNFLEDDEFYEDMDLFVELLYNTFYRPLRMDHSRYKPLRYFDAIQMVPTEDEAYWRRQLLRGHVHDPSSALHGGIAGNAGMFSTTNDLVILAQMLLNKGVYDNKRYLKAETIQKFTSVQPNSHRGLGWNKPTITGSGFGCADSASLRTYGHTGFTGTCIWVDPRSELTYVFLSNRVHPKVNNRIYQFGIRKRIHQAAYDAMMNGSGTRN